ncbi:hypothetical protein AOLI_G00216450 [Acnodon oligacanthus]
MKGFMGAGKQPVTRTGLRLRRCFGGTSSLDSGTCVGRSSGAFADFCPENASKASNHFPVFILLTPAFDI